MAVCAPEIQSGGGFPSDGLLALGKSWGGFGKKSPPTPSDCLHWLGMQMGSDELLVAVPSEGILVLGLFDGLKLGSGALEYFLLSGSGGVGLTSV